MSNIHQSAIIEEGANIADDVKESVTIRHELTDLNLPDEISKFDVNLITSTCTFVMDINLYKIKQNIPNNLDCEFGLLSNMDSIFEKILPE
jgi:hypothetical protein